MVEKTFEKPRPQLDLFGGRGFGPMNVGRKTVEGIGNILTTTGSKNAEPLVDYEAQRKQKAVQAEKEVSNKKLQEEAAKQVKSQEPYIPEIFRTTKPSSEQVAKMGADYEKAALSTIPSVQPAIDKEAAIQRMVNVFKDKNPYEEAATAEATTQQEYIDKLRIAQGVSEKGEPEGLVAKAGQELSQSYEDFTKEGGLLEQVNKEFPHLSRKEIEAQYGLGKRVLYGFFSGLSGERDGFRHLIDSKVAQNDEEYTRAISRVMEKPKAALSHFTSEVARYEQQQDFLKRTLDAKEDKIRAQFAKTTAPFEVEKLNIALADAQAAKADIIAKQNLARQQAKIATQNALFQYQNNPLAVRVPFQTAAGQSEFLIANNKDSLEALKDNKTGLPAWNTLLAPGGLVEQLRNEINKQALKPGEKARSSKENNYLFEQIRALNPQPQAALSEKTKQKEFNPRMMKDYLDGMMNYFSSWLLIHAHEAQFDTSILGAPQANASFTQNVTGE